MPTRALQSAASIQYGNTLILVGGYDTLDHESLDSAFMLNPDSLAWTELEDKMSEGKEGVVAFLVDETMFPEC